MPRIPIESKHTYNSGNSILAGSHTETNADHDHYNVDRPIIKWFIPTYPATGTDENNRIGRKIRSESLVIEYFINLFNTMDNENLNTIYDYYAYNNSDTQQEINQQVTPQSAPFNTNEQNLDCSIRHFVIEFESENLTRFEYNEDIYAFLWDWFYQLNIFTGAYNMHSNRMQIKRESTPYTGTFNILYDKVIHLNLGHPIYHDKLVIPYVRHLNFDGIGDGLPTNKVVLDVFIGPTNIYIDYGSYNLGQFIANNPPDGLPNIVVGEIAYTMKFNYTDV